jgi:hypothetical protein
MAVGSLSPLAAYPSPREAVGRVGANEVSAGVGGVSTHSETHSERVYFAQPAPTRHIAPRVDASDSDSTVKELRRKLAFSPRTAPELCQKLSPFEIEGAGNAGCPMHPQPRVRWG